MEQNCDRHQTLSQRGDDATSRRSDPLTSSLPWKSIPSFGVYPASAFGDTDGEFFGRKNFSTENFSAEFFSAEKISAEFFFRPNLFRPKNFRPNFFVGRSGGAEPF